jgi:hypothetical protein
LTIGVALGEGVGLGLGVGVAVAAAVAIGTAVGVPVAGGAWVGAELVHAAKTTMTANRMGIRFMIPAFIADLLRWRTVLTLLVVAARTL